MKYLNTYTEIVNEDNIVTVKISTSLAQLFWTCYTTLVQISIYKALDPYRADISIVVTISTNAHTLKHQQRLILKIEVCELSFLTVSPVSVSHWRTLQISFCKSFYGVVNSRTKFGSSIFHGHFHVAHTSKSNYGNCCILSYIPVLVSMPSYR